jgi:hypothetical protein
VPKLWQRTCGVSEFQPSPGPCHVDFAGLGGKRVFQELQAMLPKLGKRLVCRDTEMKNRLEMKPSMSITCHEVAVSSLDPLGPVLWHEVLALGYNIAVVVIVWTTSTADCNSGLALLSSISLTKLMVCDVSATGKAVHMPARPSCRPVWAEAESNILSYIPC